MNKKAFTLIELTVVMVIISILLAVTLINYHSTNASLVLERSAQKIFSDIRTVQEMALTAQKIKGSIPKGGYGIHFDSSKPNQYILFADFSSNYLYESNEEIKILTFESKKIQISNLTPSSSLNIIFLPPDPKLIINNNSNNNEAEIKIEIVGEPYKYRIIKVNKFGLVEII